MSVASGGLYPRGLQNVSVNNGAPAEGLQAQTLNAGNEYLATYAQGDKATSAPPITPPVPQTGISYGGHDHSGGMMGVAQRHTVWSTSFGYISGSNIDNEEAPREKDAVGDLHTSPINIWLGPFYVPGGKAYQSLEIDLLVYVETAAVDYTIEIWHPQGSNSIVETGSLALGENWITLTKRLMTRAGALQQMRVSMVLGGTGLGVCNVLFAAVHQTSNTA
jgi:hypothetical protein